MLTEILEELGFEVKIQFLSESSCNLIVNPRKSPIVAIMTHLDTVPGEIPVRVEGEKIYGRGACDAKGQIVTLIWALSEVKELNNVSIVFVGDEEEEGSGSLAYVNQYYPQNALILEPTSLKLADSAKGNLEVLIEFIGEEKHGAIPNESDAFSKFMEFLSSLKQRFSFRIISVHAGREDLYVTPSTCRVLIDITTNDWKKTYNELNEILAKYNARFEIVDFSNGWKTTGKLVDAFMDCMQKAGILPILETYPAWTDATRLAEKNIPAIIFGPGDLSVAHTHREYISLNEIAKARDVLVRFIKYAENEEIEAKVVFLSEH